RPARHAGKPPESRRPADRAAGRVALHDNRGPSGNDAAEHPGARRKHQPVDMRDVRTDVGYRLRKPAGLKNVGDAVSCESRGAVKSLDDCNRAGTGANERLAPAGEGEIAVQKLVRIGQPLVKSIV